MKMTMPLVLATVGNTDAHKPDYQKMWSDFKIAHAKSYDSNGAEEARFAIFRTNVDDIEVTNAQKLGYKLGMNLFGDLTVQEIVEQYTGARPTGPSFPGKDLGLHAAANVTLPDSIDWVAKGKVTRVKNQGHCGSCWAFSSTGALESAYAIASGNMPSLSEQQLVDCHVGNGCSGGWPYNSFRYAETHAICSESEYPYTGQDGSCHASSCTGLKQGLVTGYKTVQRTENDLLSAVVNGPVSITVEVAGGFARYSSGVLSGGCSGQINHAVLAVGYGSEDGTKYWKVKNSWGPSWGMNGYVLLQRGSGGQGAYCVLQDSPTYPVMSSVLSGIVV